MPENVELAMFGTITATMPERRPASRLTCLGAWYETAFLATEMVIERDKSTGALPGKLVRSA